MPRRKNTELQHFFAIKTDLAAAFRASNMEDIDFHLNELAVMRLHTNSDTLRRECRSTIASFAQPVSAIHA